MRNIRSITKTSCFLRLVVVSILHIFFGYPFYADVPFDFDKEYRQEFKGIIIHHTGSSGDYPTVKSLSNIQKINVYKRVFDHMPGVKIYSNHFYNNEETFFCYHWLVYPDGRKIQVLKDIYRANGRWYIDHVAWNAGTWSVNGKTVAIAIAGNYTNRYPSREALKTVTDIIAKYKKNTGIDLEIQGHREVWSTVCPGNTFLGEKGWKKTLLDSVEFEYRRYSPEAYPGKSVGTGKT